MFLLAGIVREAILWPLVGSNIFRKILSALSTGAEMVKGATGSP
jgi:hypothetical protein